MDLERMKIPPCAAAEAALIRSWLKSLWEKHIAENMWDFVVVVLISFDAFFIF